MKLNEVKIGDIISLRAFKNRATYIVQVDKIHFKSKEISGHYLNRDKNQITGYGYFNNITSIKKPKRKYGLFIEFGPQFGKLWREISKK